MYDVSNVLTLVEKSGEKKVNRILSTFISENKEVENFVKKYAIDFAKRKWSITYLVSDSDTKKLLGIFTLANKAVQIKDISVLSNRITNKIRQFAIGNSTGLDQKVYISTAYLLAQFGKNNKYSNLITGEDLLQEALSKLYEIQFSVGGKLLWLECEDDNEKALNFYKRENYGFMKFATRKNFLDGKNYIQMIKGL